jgi:hypothetical protein
MRKLHQKDLFFNMGPFIKVHKLGTSILFANPNCMNYFPMMQDANMCIKLCALELVNVSSLR